MQELGEAPSPTSTTAGVPLLETFEQRWNDDDEDSLQTSLEAELPTKAKAGILSSMASIANSVLGAGILALPFAYARAGTIGGTILVCWSAILNVVTMHLLSMTAERVSRSGTPATFRTLATRMLPKSLDWIVDATVVALMLGLATSYLMIFGNLLSTCARDAKLHHWLWHRELWVFVGLCVTSPLAFAKSLDKLKYTSTLALCMMIYVASIVVFNGASAKAQPCDHDRDEAHCGGNVRSFKVNIATLEALSLTTFAYTAHPQLVQVSTELAAYTQPKMDLIILVSISLCCGLYIVVGIVGYLTFGNTINADLLESYRPEPPVIAARVAISGVVAFSYPLMTHPCRTSLVDLSRASPRACTIFILSLTSGLALVVDNLGIILSVIGATASTAIAYIIPAAAYLAVFRSPIHPRPQDRAHSFKRGLAKFVVGYGLLTVPLCLAATFMGP